MSAYPYPNPWDHNPQAIFYRQYETVRRDEVVGILVALFLGGFGVHHFYLRRTALGVVYLCFCWTPIPWVLGFIECFFMPGRVREFNAIQAAAIAASLGIPVPGWQPLVYGNVNVPPAGVRPPQPNAPACPRCQQISVAGARFCSACGTALTAPVH